MCREPPRAQPALCLRKGGHGIQKPCPWSICHLHLSELGHAGNGFESSPGTEGRRPPLTPSTKASHLFLSVWLFCVARSTDCPHTHPGARKLTGRTSGAMEALGGRAPRRGRGQCLQDGKAGHPEHEAAPWACMPAQLWLPLRALWLRPVLFTHSQGAGTDLCSVSEDRL